MGLGCPLRLVAPVPVTFPDRDDGALKQSVSRSLALRAPEPFWQARYYDFNVWSAQKLTEKLKYLHRDPVTRGLVEKPEDWPWSSYRHYLTGVEGTIKIESERTAWKREKMGLRSEVRTGPVIPSPPWQS